MNKLYDVVLARFQKAFQEGGPSAAFPLLFSIEQQIRMEEYEGWENYEMNFPLYVRRMALSIFHGG